MIKGLKAKIKKALAASLFCFVLGIGTIAMADEGTVTVASAKIRASADTTSEQLGSVAKGGKVDIIGETTGTDGKVWYQVFVNANLKGYIRADLVNKAGDTSANTTTTTTDTSETPATAVEAKKATVVNNNVRIRKGASTEHGIVATANKGMVVTVTGETNGTDGKKWYQVSFTYNDKEITGFIRSDLLTFDNVPADTAVSEITGTEENPDATQESQTDTNGQTGEEQSSQSNESVDIILLNVDEVPYLMPGFQPVTLNWNNQQINAYMNGSFYVFYAQKQNGEEGWYVFDSEKNVYQRYAYSVEGVKVPEETKKTDSMFLIVILVVVIVILLTIIALMFLKLREYREGYTEYDNEEDDDDDDLEDLEELEEAIDEQEMDRNPFDRSSLDRKPLSQQHRRPVNRPNVQGPQQRNENMPVANGQPVRRPVNRPDSMGQPVRRPHSNGQPYSNGQPNPNGQPVRRPQPPVEGDGIVRRRPNPSGMPANPHGVRPPSGHPVRRPLGNGQPSPNGQPVQQRPQPSPVQQGHKTRNFLETDDDINFIDID